MTRLVLALVTLVCVVLCEFPSTDNRLRSKRSLVYPSPVSKVQAIMGAGFPVDLQDESVVVGVVIKALYLLPRNSSDYTNPNIYYARNRQRRSAELSTSRWDVYKILEQYAQVYGFGGKECLLRTICELADVPIDKSRGIMDEILHVLFRPTTTRETPSENSDNDYYAAQMLGAKALPGQCAKYYRDCTKSYVDLFTVTK
ncbi:uncharacterized protein [Atheta coriaria]|uniref:uncharacterized protein n=1 Tax=Dalotia coriaria TaxID=877792 RepID=UPI0031F404BC